MRKILLITLITLFQMSCGQVEQSTDQSQSISFNSQAMTKPEIDKEELTITLTEKDGITDKKAIEEFRAFLAKENEQHLASEYKNPCKSPISVSDIVQVYEGGEYVGHLVPHCLYSATVIGNEMGIASYVSFKFVDSSNADTVFFYEFESVDGPSSCWDSGFSIIYTYMLSYPENETHVGKTNVNLWGDIAGIGETPDPNCHYKTRLATIRYVDNVWTFGGYSNWVNVNYDL